MAKDKPKSFPMLPVGHWWTLRDRFKQSIPGVVTDKYLATALNTKPESARANVLPYLKVLGLVDSEGKTQDLAKAWRDDHQYSEVCREMRKRIYPEELTAAVPVPSEKRDEVERWFANHTGAGKGAAQRMAAIYTVISEANVSARPQKEAKREATPVRKKAVAVPKVEKKEAAAIVIPPHVTQQETLKAPLIGPGININLEIHISSDATPDQIDKIFESMAKHIYRK
ncbi:MAG: DUF5343 domain-containing protein [Thermodesulfobacteriota bacterium]